uniref:3-oxoacyl-[acyl-carrier protein] reductase n=1 Tax=Candidatus Kentrum sp. DK TaxID=2126562 RepID=A0A450T635_9GAMM|nr:MAG: 3-oxoacyl-[acyl-carrier protein] reductase [Candidatus Kentron sp. DK]
MNGTLCNLEGKTALVTGGSRGIGAAIARTMALAGAAVVLTYRTQQDAAGQVVSDIIEAGGQAYAVIMEVTDRVSIAEAVRAAEEYFGGLDVLVNNCGINKPTDLDRITENDWDRIMAVNLKGPFFCIQEALPALRRGGGGSIVNIGSVSGQYGGPRTAHYAASKAGLISLGQVAARFGARDNIRCNTIAAGFVSSDMAEAGLQATTVADAAKGILLGRMASPDEIANAAVYLASDAASYITAQTININGGLYF